MSTTSSSRADAALLLLLVAAGCASATSTTAPSAPATVAAPEIAPDAPQPAVPVSDRRPPSMEPKYAPIELASARVRRLDDELARLAGPEFVRKSPRPVAVEAITAAELPKPLGASSPVLIINGQLYPDTWFRAPNRLIAFISDAASLRPENTAEAMWIGTGDSTRSRRPVPFSGNPE